MCIHWSLDFIKCSIVFIFWLKCDSPSDDKNPTGSSASLTDGIDLVHKNDAWLVVSSVVEHLSDQPGTLTDVLVHNRAGHHL